MHIRPATTNDTDKIIDVVQSAYKFSYRGFVPDEYLNSLSINDELKKKWNGYVQKYECYVAEKDEIINAFLMLDCDDETKVFEICILYVAPKFQKNGIGSQMVSHACNIKKKRGYSKCKLWTIKNGPAINFYEKTGFIASGQEKSWKFDIPIIEMIKAL